MKVVMWGTYDIGKPRNRILLKGLRENGVEVVECHADVWRGVEDKSQVKGFAGKLVAAVRWFASYPGLIYRYLRLPSHDVVIVGYLGHLDVLILWPFARLRGVPVVWDAFLSLYDTVVNDRKIIGGKHPLAILIYAWEWLACRAADVVALDTQAQANYFIKNFRLGSDRVCAFYVGAESDVFQAKHVSKEKTKGGDHTGADVTVLFYGQFIPLHGIGTIVEAAFLMRDDPVDWIIIGTGQETLKIQGLLEKYRLERLRWMPWVAYESLIDHIRQADICLGIFGDTDKASRVIPNKVFQVLMAGKPLITRNSPAVRELLSGSEPGLYLVPPADPHALVCGINRFRMDRDRLEGASLFVDVRKQIVPAAIGRQAIEALQVIAQRRCTSGK